MGVVSLGGIQLYADNNRRRNVRSRGACARVCVKKGRRESGVGDVMWSRAPPPRAAHSPRRAQQPCIRKNLQTGSMRLHYFLSASTEPPI